MDNRKIYDEIVTKSIKITELIIHYLNVNIISITREKKPDNFVIIRENNRLSSGKTLRGSCIISTYEKFTSYYYYYSTI